MEMNAETLSQSPKILQDFIANLQRQLSDPKIQLAAQKAELVSCKARYEQLIEEIRAQCGEDIEVKSYHRKKHPVRRPLLLDIPREMMVHDIPEAEKICACGVCLVKIGEEITEQLKYIPHIRYK
jgi:transposase